jgi:Ribonuclease G/E
MERTPKIIYRQTSNKIIAAIDFDKRFNDKTAHIIVNKDDNNYNLKVVLAIINSKLINYYFQSFKEEAGRAFAQVKTIDIKNLPFIYPNNQSEIILINLVDKVTNIKSNAPTFDHSEVEKQIDQLIYQLYELTEEEIQIIENSKS